MSWGEYDDFVSIRKFEERSLVRLNLLHKARNKQSVPSTSQYKFSIPRRPRLPPRSRCEAHVAKCMNYEWCSAAKLGYDGCNDHLTVLRGAARNFTQQHGSPVAPSGNIHLLLNCAALCHPRSRRTLRKRWIHIKCQLYRAMTCLIQLLARSCMILQRKFYLSFSTLQNVYLRARQL